MPLRSGRLPALVGAVGGLALVLLLIALALRLAGLVPWALAVVGAEYGTFLLLRGGEIDPAAPLYAGGVLAAAELAYWWLERWVPGERPGGVARRTTLVIAACLAGGGIGGLVLSAAELSVSGGLLLEILGVAAAVGALALIARLSRAQPESR